MLLIFQRKNKNAPNIDPEAARIAKEALYEWENEVKQRETKHTSSGENIFDGKNSESARVNSGMDQETRKKLAEDQKNKGNEAVKSGVSFVV